LEKAFSAGINVNVEHFIGLSDKDYLQNTHSLTNIFPLLRNEKYSLYYREKEIENNLLNDSILVALTFKEDGKQVNQYFSITFYENGMPECVVFNDMYMYSYLSRLYEDLKHRYRYAVQKPYRIDFTDDIFFELQKHKGSCLIKPNPCYDKLPIEVYESLLNRMSGDELNGLLSVMLGEKTYETEIPVAKSKAIRHIEKSYEYASMNKQVDVYSMEGLADFAQTGKLTDHPEHLPSLNQEERWMTLEHLYNRSNDTDNGYTLYITEYELPHKDLVFEIEKGFGLLIGNINSDTKGVSRKTTFIQSERLASIFCDYAENHIPVNGAMEKEKANNFLRSLVDTIDD